MKKTARHASVINQRRAYFECRYGQLHVRTAFPSTGGFDELTPLVCLHESPRESGAFGAFLPAMAADRSVYACDTPGHGASDAPPALPSIGDYALAIGDFLDSLRLREADLVGTGVGAAIAVELAVARPQGIRRVVLADLPSGSPLPPAARPVAADGSHLAAAWRYSRAERGADEPLERFAAGFAEEVRQGARARWGAAAAAAWPARERLPLVRQRVLLLVANTQAAAAIGQVRSLLKDSLQEDYPAAGAALFDLRATDVASRVRQFLDR